MFMKFWRNKIMMIKIVNSMLWDLPVPSSINYMWNFGSSLGVILIFQILTGIFLTFHYVSFSHESFNSILKIMREVWGGWLIRFFHMNGASCFFFFIYLHLFRGLYYFSGVHKKLWISGTMILLLLMAVSFLGYVLPWGQMSFWGVAVITNLFSIFPFFGEDLVIWLWGGFSVSTPTLIRFFSFHYIFPFLLLLVMIFHLLFLHEKGSSNPLGISSDLDKISFHSYFTYKDLFFIISFFLVFFFIIFFFPYVAGDPINNVPANPLSTPLHIQPEWYFLPFYAILRSFSSKFMGVIFLFLGVGVFFFIPLMKFNYKLIFSNLRKILFFCFISSFIMLLILGSLPAEGSFIVLSKIFCFFYFNFLFLLFF